MSREWKPRLPYYCHCAICGKRVEPDEPFIASKPRRGGLIVIHTECWEKEQRELKEASKDANP